MSSEQQLFLTLVTDFVVSVPARAGRCDAAAALSLACVARSQDRHRLACWGWRAMREAERDEIVERENHAALIRRRVRRAVGATGLQVHVNDDVMDWVRHVAREYRVERAVALEALRGPGRAAAEQLRRIVDSVLSEDEDSTSEDEP